MSPWATDRSFTTRKISSYFLPASVSCFRNGLFCWLFLLNGSYYNYEACDLELIPGSNLPEALKNFDLNLGMNHCVQSPKYSTWSRQSFINVPEVGNECIFIATIAVLPAIHSSESKTQEFLRKSNQTDVSKEHTYRIGRIFLSVISLVINFSVITKAISEIGKKTPTSLPGLHAEPGIAARLIQRWNLNRGVTWDPSSAIHWQRPQPHCPPAERDNNAAFPP